MDSLFYLTITVTINALIIVGLSTGIFRFLSYLQMSDFLHCTSVKIFLSIGKILLCFIFFLTCFPWALLNYSLNSHVLVGDRTEQS
jgi:hypothetical protein